MYQKTMYLFLLFSLLSAGWADTVEVKTIFNQGEYVPGCYGTLTRSLRGLVAAPDGNLMLMDCRNEGMYAVCSNDGGDSWTNLQGASGITVISPIANNIAESHYLGSDPEGNGYCAYISQCAGGSGQDATPGLELHFKKLTKNGASWSLGNQVVLDTRSGHCLTTGPFFKEPSGRLWYAGNFIFGGLLSIYAKYSDDGGATWNYADVNNGQIACDTKTTGAQGAWYQSLFVPYHGSLACIYMTYENLYWTYFDGSNWITCQQIPFQGDYSEAALGSAVTDSDSNMYVSIFWNGHGKVIKWDGASWANTGADFPSQSFIEACGNTIVAFYADSNEFYCRKYSANVWGDPVLVSTETRAITNRKIIVPQFAPDNCAYAVYTDGPGYDLGGGFVKLAKIGLTGGSAIIQKPVDHFNVRAFPNPFNPNLTVSYSVAAQNRPADVTVRILNAGGETVATLVSGTQVAGNYKATWNAEKRASGLYFCSIKVNDQTLLKKVVLLK